MINLKVLDKEGRSTDAGVIEAIDRAIELQEKHNVRIINLSLGRHIFESCASDPLCEAVEKAWNKGILVVVAAGNDGRMNDFGNEGYGTINSPANSPYVLTVGAMKSRLTPLRSDDEITSYSSKGPTLIDQIVKPDIVALGNRIAASLENGYLVRNYGRIK